MQQLSRLDEEVPVAEDATLSDPVFDRAADEPDRVVFSRKQGDEWQPVTAKEFAEQVERLAAGLIAAGVESGDRVGLMSHTRYEWTLCDYAIWTAGAVTVPVYETSSAEQLAWYLGDSGAVAAFVENEEYEKTLKEACSDLPDIANVWRLEGDGLDALREAGKDVTAEQVQERRTLGSKPLRVGSSTASARSLPSLMCARLLLGVRNATCTWPPTQCR